MTKKEQIEELKKAGFKIDGRASQEKVNEQWQILQNRLKGAQDEVEGKNKMTTDELVKDAIKYDEGYVRKSGIIIPTQALSGMARSKYTFSLECSDVHCEVFSTDHRDKKTSIRIYSEQDHGDGFKELAQMFVDKKNRLGR